MSMVNLAILTRVRHFMRLLRRGELGPFPLGLPIGILGAAMAPHTALAIVMAVLAVGSVGAVVELARALPPPEGWCGQRPRGDEDEDNGPDEGPYEFGRAA